MTEMTQSSEHRRRREALGLSRAQIAMRARIDPSTVALIENGWRPMRRSGAMEKLESALTREEARDGAV